MYLKYHTEGFVLGSRAFGESSKIFYIFTERFGLIRASAQSVRKPGLKLKANLEDYSLGYFTLVRGKHDWKITDAVTTENFYFDVPAPRSLIFIKISSLLKKLLPEEEPHENLFLGLYSSFFFLTSQECKTEYLENLECIIILRIVNDLGYLENETWLPFLSQNLTTEVLEDFSPLRQSAVFTINKSLEVSGLVSTSL